MCEHPRPRPPVVAPPPPPRRPPRRPRAPLVLALVRPSARPPALPPVASRMRSLPSLISHDASRVCSRRHVKPSHLKTATRHDPRPTPLAPPCRSRITRLARSFSHACACFVRPWAGLSVCVVLIYSPRHNWPAAPPRRTSRRPTDARRLVPRRPQLTFSQLRRSPSARPPPPPAASVASVAAAAAAAAEPGRPSLPRFPVANANDPGRRR